MGEKKYTRTEPGIRVDHRDYENTSFTSQFSALSQLTSQLVVGEDGPFRVLHGFTALSTAGGVLTIRRGAAVLGSREGGVTYPGVLAAGGPLTKSVKVSGFANDTYGVYVRFDFTESDIGTRAFWDDVSSPATETSRTIPTRYSNDWSLVLDADSPGDEWHQIGTVAVSSGAITTYTSQRDLMFDGKDSNGYVIDDTEWGDALERTDTARSTYHTKGLAKFAKACLRQIQDIIGDQPEAAVAGKGWWKTVAKSLAEMLPLDGSRDLIGTLGSRSIVPTSNNTYDLGASAGNKFRSIYSFDVISPDAHIDDVYATNSLQIDTSAGNAPAGRNHIYRDTTAKAYLHLVTDGTASPTVLKAVNFDSVTGLTVSTTDIIFPFARAMSDAYYVIQGTACTSTAAYIICPISRSSGSFTFEVRDHANGKANPGLSGTTGIIIDIVVFGMWVA